METSDSARCYYNTISPTYKFDLTSFETKRQCALVRKFLKSDFYVAELGCATGDFAKLISTFVSRVDGFDTSEEMIRIASAAHNSNLLNFIHKTKPLKIYQKKGYNLIYSFATLLWVQKPKELIIQAIDALCDDGILILDIGGKHNLSWKFWNNYYRSMSHPDLTPWTLQSISRFLTNNHMDILEIHSIGFLDQWKYLPFITTISSKLSFINKLIHFKYFDLDYIFSNMYIFKPFANRWYIVCRKN